MTKIKSKWPGHHEDIFYCDCYDRSHAITIDFDDEDPQFRFLSFVERFRPRGIKDRIQLAWRMLLGKDSTIAEVLLADDILLDLTKTLVRHCYVTLYGHDLDAHIDRLRLAIADYFNSMHNLIDLSVEEASKVLITRCMELIDIFEDNSDTDKHSSST